MLPIGMLLVWGGYSLSLWGWCLIRGYDVTLGQLMSPLHPYGAGKGQPWPPPLMSANQIFPGGKNTGTSAPPPSAAPSAGSTRTGTPSGKLGPGGTVPK